MTHPQDKIKSLIDNLVAQGKERGLQVSAYHKGAEVINACAGVMDTVTRSEVREDTLFPAFSVTKGLVATLIHLLAERGELEYDQPISSIWPEFSVHGKERITIRQALTHSAGIPQMPPGTGHRELCDWDIICAKVADLEPIWKPGTRIEYHGVTYGWILGEVAHRIDGRPFPQLLEEEICRPLGIDTMFVGIPDEVEERVAILEEYDLDPQPPDDGTPRSVPALIMPLHAWMNRPDARRACIPASSGIMNAGAIARHYAALLPGGVDGIMILPPDRVQTATEQQRPDHPENDNYDKCWGLGYQIGTPGSVYGEGRTSFGHGGYGGSIGFADLEKDLAIGVMKNLFHKEDTTRLIVNAIREAVTA